MALPCDTGTLAQIEPGAHVTGGIDGDAFQVTAFEVRRLRQRETTRADGRSLRRSEQASTQERVTKESIHGFICEKNGERRTISER